MNETTIVADIDAIIAKAKKLPNGLNRNKITSHLEDAKAHAQALELYDLRSGNPYVVSPVAKFSNRFSQDDIRTMVNQPCTCPDDGVIDKLCPTHGDVPSY